MKVRKQVELKNGQIVTIRPAEKQDVDGLVEFLNIMFSDDRWYSFTNQEAAEMILTAQKQQERLDKLAETKGLLLVGLYGSRIIAEMNLMVIPSNRRSHVRHLGVNVAPDFQGQGLGTILMETALDCAHNAGIEILELRVCASNEKAINLYRKMGFITEGLQKNAFKHAPGRYEDCLLMARELESAICGVQG